MDVNIAGLFIGWTIGGFLASATRVYLGSKKASQAFESWFDQTVSVGAFVFFYWLLTKVA